MEITDSTPSLYGIGVGPGNSRLLTLEAVKTVKNCGALFFPSKDKDKCRAYKIAEKEIPDLNSRELYFFDFPMTKNMELLDKAHSEAADLICSVLERGLNCAFLTIGDVSVYSTFAYVQTLVEEKGYRTCMINGIPSFCAAASVLGIPLSVKDEQIHIICGNSSLEESFKYGGTVVYMKSGSHLRELEEFLKCKQAEYDFEFHAVSEAGMENEAVIHSLEEIKNLNSYMTVAIVKNIKQKVPEDDGLKKNCSADKNKETRNYSFFQNKKCEKFPCHSVKNIEDFNCMFCYCPLYALGENCGGNFLIKENGIKSCINCSFPHERKNYDLINERFGDIARL